MNRLYCVVTENCNLRCNHCYLSASPGKKHTTISPSNFEKMLEHIPKLPLELILTGGEIFTIEDSLNEYLELINRDNTKRANNKKIQLSLQTNGFWLKRKNAEEKLLSLKKEELANWI